ncbi:hypothetical protein E4634_20635 [Mangrovimicrobium sediminis]|uniref:Outer membrane lipoprotein Blc n=1 Tax=Mangrovimicrobium sediminis TaxID=2562682 RepID=A0A4Z0LUP7_9GAMM|nr:lipocalin family protein [Haliea sp. SAOS-164]TGD70816.1 hypothetical protein E4634_20635 [Haliea sp. SAOS-164]
MRKLLNGLKILLLAGGLLALGGCRIETVPYVDVPSYMGLWYQIAANPVFFNEDLVGVTAEYSLNEDGTVKVINQGYKGTLDGELDRIEGEARVFNPRTNASLIVTFPDVPDFPFPNYLIVVLDDAQYQYAVVTDPLQSTLFVLSRTPQMDPALYQNILSMLQAKEIDTSSLVLTPQPLP